MGKQERFVILKGKKEGPFSIDQLLRMEGVHKNTLAWREGMEKWLPIKEIPELKFFFIENEPLFPPEVAEAPKSEDIVLNLPSVQPPILFWIFFITLLLMYVLYQFYFSR